MDVVTLAQFFNFFLGKARRADTKEKVAVDVEVSGIKRRIARIR